MLTLCSDAEDEALFRCFGFIFPIFLFAVVCYKTEHQSHPGVLFGLFISNSLTRNLLTPQGS